MYVLSSMLPRKFKGELGFAFTPCGVNAMERRHIGGHLLMRVIVPFGFGATIWHYLVSTCIIITV